jgi:hypothetical protein
LSAGALRAAREVFVVKDLLTATGEHTLSVANSSTDLLNGRGDTVVIFFELAKHPLFECNKSCIALVVGLLACGDCSITLDDGLITLVESLLALVDSLFTLVDSLFALDDGLLALDNSLLALDDSLLALDDNLLTLIDSLFTLVQSGVCAIKTLLGVVDLSVTKGDFFFALVDGTKHFLGCSSAHGFTLVGDGRFCDEACVVVRVAV